jgi:hypothetical protein
VKPENNVHRKCLAGQHNEVLNLIETVNFVSNANLPQSVNFVYGSRARFICGSAANPPNSGEDTTSGAAIRCIATRSNVRITQIKCDAAC